eukprot:gene797-61933_t
MRGSTSSIGDPRTVRGAPALHSAAGSGLGVAAAALRARPPRGGGAATRDGRRLALPPPGCPRYDGYGSCLVAGCALSVLQVCLIRVLQRYALRREGAAWDVAGRDDALAWAAYGLRTAALLCVLAAAGMQQAAACARFGAMLLRGEARRAGVPVLLLNSTRNLDAFDAVRRYLLSLATRPNPLLAVLDPTVALIITTLVVATGGIVVRQLFDAMHFDNVTLWAVDLVAVCVVALGAICFYANRIQTEVQRHAQILAHVQWEMTRQWNITLQRLEKGGLNETRC